MRLLQAHTQTSQRTQAADTPETRLHGRWLLLARVVWVIIAALALGLYVATIPTHFASLHVPCTSASAICMYKQITPNNLRELQEWGLSLDFFATYWIAVYIVFTVVYTTIGAVIFWRKSDDRMAFFASLTLMTFPAAFNYAELATLPSAWWLPSHLVDFLGSISLPLFFYLFPTGHFVPRWTRWLSIAALLFLAVEGFLPPSLNFRSSTPTLSGIVFLGFICSILGTQIYRYRHVSNAVQRQQTKWVVFGIAIGLGSFLLLVVFTRFFPSLIPQGLLASLIMNTAFSLSLLLFPLSIGIAILRSQLWDIDILINRTLVYGTLTGILATVYVGLIIRLQSLVSAITSQGTPSQPVIVASTLAIAVLFQPLRRRIQIIIDRRFYRHKYDAAHTLEAFSATMQNEVELTQLSEQLLSVVNETMQPAQVSLWLRPPQWRKEDQPHRLEALGPRVTNRSPSS